LAMLKAEQQVVEEGEEEVEITTVLSLFVTI
jgi:hypothetical protein